MISNDNSVKQNCRGEAEALYEKRYSTLDAVNLAVENTAENHASGMKGSYGAWWPACIKVWPEGVVKPDSMFGDIIDIAGTADIYGHVCIMSVSKHLTP